MKIITYFSTYKGKLNLLVIAGVLIPLIISSVIIGIMLDRNHQGVYQNRLKAELEALSLIIATKEKDLEQSLNKLIFDNTLQITLELNIIPQLEKYLIKQLSGLKLSYLQITNANQSQIITTQTDYSIAPDGCQKTSVIKVKNETWLCQTQIIVKNERMIGMITGTINLNDPIFLNYIQDKLIDKFIIWVDGEIVFSSLSSVTMLNNHKPPLPGKISEIELNGKDYKILVNDIDMNGKKLTYGLLLARDELQKGYWEIFQILALVLILLFVVVLFTVQKYLNKFILPITKLTLAVSATQNMQKMLPDLDFERKDEIGILNQTFRDMHIAIKNHVEEIVDKNNKLERAYEALKKYGHELESMVEVRTLELNTTLMDVEQARSEAEIANEAKSDFLSNISHELRTPMQSILGFSRLAIERFNTLSSEKKLEYFKNVEYSGTRLLLLLNDLLDLAKLEKSQALYFFTPASLSKLIEVTILELGTLINEKNISIHFKKPDFNDVAAMDTEKILQVLRNLLSNAIKFSRNGDKIELKLDDGSDNLIFSVIDQGVGIPKNELDIVFDKFIQSSKTKTGAGGTGLGLSISKEIIKMHKGKIWAENNLKKGVTFRFIIPCEQEESEILIE